MEFLRSNKERPFSSAVIHNGKVLETVLTGMPPGESRPVPLVSQFNKAAQPQGKQS